MAISDKYLIGRALGELEKRLPPQWSLDKVSYGVVVGDPTGRFDLDAVVDIRSPDARLGRIEIECKLGMTPKLALKAVDFLKRAGAAAPVVVSDFLSERTQQVVRERGAGYIDVSGNMRIVLSNPGFFVEAVGAKENPAPSERRISLAAEKAALVVRTLIEQREPSGVRDIGASLDVDAGYVSRVLLFLDTEGLVQRVGRGRLESVDWLNLLRRWAKDAPFTARGPIENFFDPRGPSNALEKLRGIEQRYAVTGSFAATRLRPVAPARLLSVYVDDVDRVASALDLRRADAGANVQLIAANSDDVYLGSVVDGGIRYASPVQIALDLMTAPGRGPAEAEELVEWMKANEEKWRG